MIAVIIHPQFVSPLLDDDDEEDDDEEELDELDEVYVVLRARILFTSDAKLTSEDLLVTKWLCSCAVMSSVPIKSIHS